jgi:hypothetical protein
MWEVSVERGGVEHVLALVNDEAEAEARRVQMLADGWEVSIVPFEFRGCGCGA